MARRGEIFPSKVGRLQSVRKCPGKFCAAFRCPRVPPPSLREGGQNVASGEDFLAHLTLTPPSTRAPRASRSLARPVTPGPAQDIPVHTFESNIQVTGKSCGLSAPSCCCVCCPSPIPPSSRAHAPHPLVLLIKSYRHVGVPPPVYPGGSAQRVENLGGGRACYDVRGDDRNSGGGGAGGAAARSREIPRTAHVPCPRGARLASPRTR